MNLMTYKITQKVTDLVGSLFEEGYAGEASITNSYCAGTKSVLGESFSVLLSGFCKESLHLAEDIESGEIVFVGQYEQKANLPEPNVADVVCAAWEMFDAYEYRGYNLPEEFRSLFLKYGYIEEKVVTTKVYIKKV